ncbi:MAG TPA: hypothetical protein VM307_01300 [Egibacteraceae bacterium]|nr:hypothetical protein [Egibacteraceae bacterium]
MIRRTVTLVVATLLALGLVAGPSMAKPNVACLRTGVGVLQDNPGVRLSLAKSGQLGGVIADHLSADAADRWEWCR